MNQRLLCFIECAHTGVEKGNILFDIKLAFDHEDKEKCTGLLRSKDYLVSIYKVRRIRKSL